MIGTTTKYSKTQVFDLLSILELSAFPSVVYWLKMLTIVICLNGKSLDEQMYSFWMTSKTKFLAIFDLHRGLRVIFKDTYRKIPNISPPE